MTVWYALYENAGNAAHGAAGETEETNMFRTLVRRKQQLPQEECVRILETEKRGVLSVLGDDGYPYGMPLITITAGKTGRSTSTAG